MSAFVAVSDKLYYVNLKNWRKSLKIKEKAQKRQRECVAERGADPAFIYNERPRGGPLRGGVPPPLVPSQKWPLNLL